MSARVHGGGWHNGVPKVCVMKNKKQIERLERLANETGLSAPERYHRIVEVWRARRIEIPGYFEHGKFVY